MAKKIYIEGNYFRVVDPTTGQIEQQDHKSDVYITPEIEGGSDYRIDGERMESFVIAFADIQTKAGTPYANQATWETFYQENTGFDAAPVSGASLNNTVFVNSKSDFPTPSGGIITLALNTTYLLGDNVDLLGDRFNCLNESRVTCHGAASNIISSTGLAAGSYLFTCSDVSFSIANIAINCSGAKLINYSDSTNGKTLGITQALITNSTDLGLIDGGLFHRLFGNSFPNCSGGFIFQGIIDEIEILNNNIIDWTGTPTFLTIPSGTFHSINIGYNSLHIEPGHTGLNISSDITLTSGGLISNNFFQNGGAYLTGIDATTQGWRIPPNSNVGIPGLTIDVQSPVKKSWTSTSTVFIEITDPTAAGEIAAFVGPATSYDPDAAKLEAEFTCEVKHDQVSQDVVIEIYNTTDDLSMGFGGDAKLDVNTIAWQSGNIIRYAFNLTPDLSQAKVGDKMIIDTATNASNNGTFEITAINDGADWIEISNPNRTDAINDEASDSPALAHGGSVRWVTVATAGVYESATTESFGLDPNKSYVPRLRRGSNGGGNPSVYIQFGVLTTKIF